MTAIVTLLTDGFADWETALLNAVAHGFYGIETHFVSPHGRTVTSAGGMKVTPDGTLDHLDLNQVSAFVICGGSIWKTTGAPDIKGIANAAHNRGRLIAAICDGTYALAKTGLLDTVRHTSNMTGYLDDTGYKGKGFYVDSPRAILDQNIITAPATAPVSFMVEVMRALGRADEKLDKYVAMHAAEHKRA